jgi:hypothetical protein
MLAIGGVVGVLAAAVVGAATPEWATALDGIVAASGE